MEYFRIRDRDAPLSPEGIIFRVYGYNHPKNACLCDVEYANSRIYNSKDPRAPRFAKDGENYYKFYADGGLNFVKHNYPQYLIFYPPFQNNQVGIKKNQMKELRQPDKKLKEILSNDPPDRLIELTMHIFELIEDHSTLKRQFFGVFGSILHDFYHLDYSDIDLIIYGKKNLEKFREVMSDFYSDNSFPINNEFDGPAANITPRHWYYKNYSVQEYLKYQRQKLIYATIKSKKMNRIVKIEFEPVKTWNEIREKNIENLRIEKVGWIRASGRIIDGSNGFYIGGSYSVAIDKILEGPKIDGIEKIVNYLEEYRGQLRDDEKFLVEGNLEKVITPRDEFHQITLTYGPNYDDQVLKKL
jgi:predicted nucleotidyltransferase